MRKSADNEVHLYSSLKERGGDKPIMSDDRNTIDPDNPDSNLKYQKS